MTSFAICSGGFRQLRNSIQRVCHDQLFQRNVRLFSRKFLDHGSHDYERGNFTTREETLEANCVETITGHYTSQDRCNTTIRSLIHELGTAEHQLTPERKIERPATFLVFDIETTGFSRTGDRIIEIAIQDLSGGTNSTFETLVNPEMEIPDLSTLCHGISTDLVCRPDVPRFKDLIPVLKKFVQSRQVPGKPVIWIAHCAKSFDVRFLVQEFCRCSAEIPADWLFVDSMCLARKLENVDGSKVRPINLKGLCKHYGIPEPAHAHRAMHDVMALSRVFQKMNIDLKLSYKAFLNLAFRASDITMVPKWSS